MFNKLFRRETLSEDEKKPVAIPLKYTRRPLMDETVRQLVRGELSRRAEAEGKETFEEANDFNVGDDVDEDFGRGHEQIYDPIDEEVVQRIASDRYAQEVENRVELLDPLVKGKKKKAPPKAAPSKATAKPVSEPSGGQGRGRGNVDPEHGLEAAEAAPE